MKSPTRPGLKMRIRFKASGTDADFQGLAWPPFSAVCLLAAGSLRVFSFDLGVSYPPQPTPLWWAWEQPSPSSKTLATVWSTFTVWNINLSSPSSCSSKSPKQEKAPDVLFGKCTSFLSCTGFLGGKHYPNPRERRLCDALDLLLGSSFPFAPLSKGEGRLGKLTRCQDLCNEGRMQTKWISPTCRLL